MHFMLLPCFYTKKLKLKLIITICIVSVCLVSTSCTRIPTSLFQAFQASNSELSELYKLLGESKEAGEERFGLTNRIAKILLQEKKYDELEYFLTTQVEKNKQDAFNAYYLYIIASAFRSEKQDLIACIYYDRIIKNFPDLLVKNESIHLRCLKELTNIVTEPNRLLDYYLQLIARFPDTINMGEYLFRLAQTYEQLGAWDEAIRTYKQFLPYLVLNVPGYPDALQHARFIVDFYDSRKSWTYPNLESLVGAVKKALNDKNALALNKLKARVNFFSMNWNEDMKETDSETSFDFSSVVGSRTITISNELDTASNSKQAFLKTTGWGESAPTWYFLFRKINFPADPLTHGRWEWAGVYFGEKPF